MNVTELAVRRPITILMLILGLVLMGVISYGLLPVRELPNVNYPYLQVTVSDPGADPQDVRTSVTDPLENALTAVNGVTSMTSVSMQGVSDITLQFAAGININTANNDVAQALHAVARKLPATASLPSITATNPAAAPIMSLSLSGKLNQMQFYTLAQKSIVPAIESVPGVGAVDLQGGLIPQINVQVNESALLAYNVTLPQIRQALATQNTSAPVGALNNGSQTYTVGTQTPFTTAASLANVVIQSTPKPGKTGAGTSGVGTGAAGGAASQAPKRLLTLGQLATLSQGYATPLSINRLNGKTAVGITITAQSGANSLSVESGVLSAINKLKKTLPPGATLRVIADQTVYTKAALSAVLRDLILAVVLASAVLYVFLRRFSHTLIVFFAIPASLLSTFIVMYAFGFSLDLMSMLALSLLIGILVDDSIVVLENIDRHLKLGADPRTAAVRGRTEIGAAAVAITLTDVVVYIPIVFVQGTVGQLFREFGLTIAAATLFSLFTSFTLTPMLASRWLKGNRDFAQRVSEGEREVLGEGACAAQALRHSPKMRRFAAFKARCKAGSSLLRAGERFMDALKSRYERLLKVTLSHRLRALAVAASALLVSACFLPFGFIGTSFVPPENPQTFRVGAQMPTGTSLLTTDAAMRVFSAKLKKIPGIQAVFATAGVALNGLNQANDAVLTVVRADQGLQAQAQKRNKSGVRAKGSKKARARGGKKAGNGISLSGANATPLPPIDPLLARIQTIAKTIPGLQIQTDVPNPLVINSSTPVSVQVSGQSPVVLQALAQSVQGLLTRLPDLTNVKNQSAASLPVWLIHVNDAQAAQLGVTTQLVSQAAQAAIGGVIASTIQSAGSGVQTNIMVSMQNGSHFTPTELAGIPIASRHGQMVTLGEVASILLAPGPVSLTEANRQLTSVVTAGTTNPSLGQVAQQVQQALSSLQLPPGYSVTLGGEIAQQSQAFGPLLQSLVLSVILIYMLMAALYESLVMPLVVLCSLPLATVGAFFGLWLSGQTLNIFSFMALIMLMGLVAKNAILLVDYARQRIKQGMTRADALIDAGKTRLRPIVMTTSTMVFSMIPLAFHTGFGSADRVPIAAVLIGGLTSSTLLTLLLVPVLFTYVDDARQWMARWAKRKTRVSLDVSTASPGGAP
ncbi:efflux RND transporter permease subunit [Ferroacidibacillus organovorans]|uniref:SSD domain-containing protein n=1 Tax=Ferroacidibacillus organovorans TaxID=1765683 RepID=A0A101XNU0_9BACL|nr:efflux RND transporter permease subunit [Ferroacidibacillus organovorans]KUO94719.1 hypothetical protein ATW55_02325 [Ferroacidibacillus organovorans]